MRFIRKKKNPETDLQSSEEEGRRREEIEHPKYFEQEYEIKRFEKDELERLLNELLKECSDYGDITIKIDEKIHIVKRETLCKENHYFVRVMKDTIILSTEREVRNLKNSGTISQNAILVDVTFFKNYRILVFRK